MKRRQIINYAAEMGVNGYLDLVLLVNNHISIGPDRTDN